MINKFDFLWVMVVSEWIRWFIVFWKLDKICIGNELNDIDYKLI